MVQTQYDDLFGPNPSKHMYSIYPTYVNNFVKIRILTIRFHCFKKKKKMVSFHSSFMFEQKRSYW